MPSRKVPAGQSSRKQLGLLLLMLSGISALIVVLSGDIVGRTVSARLDSELSRVAELRTEQLGQSISTLRKDVLFLSRIPAVDAMVRAHARQKDSDYKAWRERLEQIFTAYMAANDDIVQARLIGVGNGGREMARVNRKGDLLRVVPESELQYKGDTDYFRATLKLAPGQTYISPFNLNREQGRVVLPPLPVVRSTAPIYGSDGRLLAMIVLNYDSRGLFARLVARLPAHFVIYIVNQDGDYLQHPDAAHTYGFELGRRFRWQDEFVPEAGAGTVAGVARWHDRHGDAMRVASRTVAPDDDGPSPHLELRVAAAQDVVDAGVRSAELLALLGTLFVSGVAAGFFLLYAQSIRRKVQVSLEQKRLAAIVSSSGDAIISMTTSGEVLSWNEAAERMFGYREAEALGRHKSDLIGLPERQAEQAQLMATITRGERVQHLDTTRRCRDGGTLDVSIAASPVRDERGRVIAVVESIRDITRQKVSEAQIKALNSNLEQQIAERTQELEVARDKAEQASQAKSAFVANISHEIRTPMNAVLGMTQLLEGTPMSATQHKYLKMLRGAGETLLSLLNDILDFSRIEADRLEISPVLFRLDDVLSTLAAIMSTIASQKRLELVIGVDPAVPQHLVGDAMRLQQILVNLLGNAIKFTDQGEVALLVHCVAIQGEQATLTFRVRDTGIGMSEAQREQIFSPFFQGDTSISRRFGGTGLGLAITRRLVALMGGDISLESTSGAGSDFLVTLPLQVSQAADAASPLRDALGDLHVLVVDDNPTSREYLCKMAEGWHWRADSAASGEEAVALVRTLAERGGCYGVAIIDCQMPGLDGLGTLRAIRDVLAGQALPMILMGSAADQDLLARLSESGEADAVLIKPVTSSGLFDTLLEALAEKTGVRVPSHQGESASMTGGRLAGLRFLLAEDNALNQFVARSLLERAGAVVEVVGNGQQAIDCLRAAPDRYDMVLMDVQMPVMDGLTAVRAIRHDLKLSLPVLAMTAGVLDVEREQCAEAGMNGFILKPIEVEQMLLMIETHRRVPGRQDEQPDAGGDAAVFDIGALAAMAAHDNAHRQRLAEMVAKVVASGLGPLEEARDAWRAGRREEAARMLHTLRGSLGSLGARHFAGLALQVEAAIRDDEAGAEALFAQAIQGLAEMLQAARQWLRSQAQG